MPIWKGKGISMIQGDTEALLNQALTLMERILDARLRHIVESKIGENQLGFRKGRGVDDGLFTIRQIIEKSRLFRKNVAFGFVDTVPRELAFAVD